MLKHLSFRITDPHPSRQIIRPHSTTGSLARTMYYVFVLDVAAAASEVEHRAVEGGCISLSLDPGP